MSDLDKEIILKRYLNSEIKDKLYGNVMTDKNNCEKRLQNNNPFTTDDLGEKEDTSSHMAPVVLSNKY